MDRKSIIVLAGCFALMMLWSFVLVPKLYPPKPLPPGATNSFSATQAFNESNLTANPASASGTALPYSAPRFLANTNLPEELVMVTNKDARYTFTSYGGGLKLIELVGYPETVASRRGKQPETNRWATLNTLAAVPTLAVLDGPAWQGNGIFNLTRTATGVRAEKMLNDGLVLVKEFALETNYLVSATIRLENDSTNTLSLPAQEWVVGTATPMSPQDNGLAVGMIWYNGEKAADIVGASYFSSRGFACTPRIPPAEYRGGQSNVVWAAVHNQFFALAVMPEQPAMEVLMRRISLPPPSESEILDTPRAVRFPEGYEAALVYPALTLGPKQSAQHQFYLFAGPKEYRMLAGIAARFNNNVDAVMNFGWTGFISKALLLGMNWLHSALSLPYGWAIIAITVIIKLIFWPLTQASTRSMKRMQELAPQMKALQAKYKDDPQKLSQKQWEFWKKNKVNPMGGCLPMMLQMPVLFGFFYMIRSAIELRGAPFLWVADLAKPDTLFIIPGLNLPFNLLPLLMTGTSVWQAHLTPPSPGADPMQQKMMRYMPVIMVAIFYTMPAGLTLYYTVQSLLSVLQTKLIRTQPVATTSAPALTPPLKKGK
jgi:YidC/Oxa1 family membrane protein insertase